jgi:hypothetical protein
MKRQILMGVMAGGSVFAAPNVDLPEAKITVRVVDEDSRPKAGVDVSVTFEMPKYKPGVWGSSDMMTRRGLSNSEGLFSATAKSGNYVGYSAQATGYYPSTGKPLEFARSEGGRWQPWDATVELILKKIIRPAPMYARRLEAEIPVVDETVGFDLMEGDWITPHGRGKSGDILFRVTKRVASFHNFDAELVVNFPNKGDGIALMADTHGGSELRSAHEAPEAGYDPSLSLLQGNSKERGQYGMANEGKNYFFRIRTVLDERRQVVSCLYGKIYGGIEYFPVSYKGARLRFIYYLNPTVNDRSVEFDPKRNLFLNLKSSEQVTAP